MNPALGMTVHTTPRRLAACLCLLLATSGHALRAGAQSVRGAAVTGVYRNLFVEAGHAPNEVSAKIESAFQQLFHGDTATETVYYSAGTNANGPLAYVTDINNHDVRTEGMSYGMMIAVQLDKKAEF
ncbi:MAG: glycoside hydrolase, partial [Deltaproteobacteria bacterium]